MKEAEIHFLPVCSHCGVVLWGELINYEPVFEEPEKDDYKIKFQCGHEIKPYMCKNCGALFTSIHMPLKLPFDTEEELWGHSE